MTTIRVSLSDAFHCKELKPLRNDSAKARSFEAKSVTVDALIAHMTSGGAWTPATFEKNYRNQKNVIQSQIIGLDIDDHDSARAVLAGEYPDINDYAAVIHHTASSTDDEPKVRVVFVFDRAIADKDNAVARDKFALALKATKHHFSGLKMDEQTLETARYFYGAECTAWVRDPDKRLPLEVIAEWVTAYKADKAAQPAPAQPTKNGAGSEYAASAYKGELDKLRAAPEGERNDTLFKVAANIFGMVKGAWHGINELNATADLRAAALELRLNEREIDATIKSARDSAEARPMVLTARPALALPAPRSNGHKPGVVTLDWDNITSEFEKRLTTPEVVPGFSTGIYDLDIMTGGLQRGSIYTLVGETGSMKTQFSMGVAWRGMHQTPTIILSLESNERQILNRIIAYAASISGVGFGDIGKGRRVVNDSGGVRILPFTPDEVARIRQAMLALRHDWEDKRLLIISRPGLIQLDELYHAIGAIKQEYSPGLMIWDGFGDIPMPGASIFDRTTTTMAYAERMAQDFELAIFGTAQGGRNTKGRGDKTLGLQDGYGGSAIEFKSACHMSIYDPWLLVQRGAIDEADALDSGIPRGQVALRINKLREGALVNNSVMMVKRGGAGFYALKREPARVMDVRL